MNQLLTISPLMTQVTVASQEDALGVQIVLDDPEGRTFGAQADNGEVADVPSDTPRVPTRLPLHI